MRYSLARAARLRHPWTTRVLRDSSADFKSYLEDISRGGACARAVLHAMLVAPGAEITQNLLTGRKNSHIIALEHQGTTVSADQQAEEILLLDSPAGGPQHRLSSASLEDPAGRDRHVLPVGSPQAARRAGRRLGGGKPGRSVLGDEPEALSVCREQRLPQAETPPFVEDAVRCGKTCEAVARALRSNVDVALTLYRNGSWAA